MKLAPNWQSATTTPLEACPPLSNSLPQGRLPHLPPPPLGPSSSAPSQAEQLGRSTSEEDLEAYQRSFQRLPSMDDLHAYQQTFQRLPSMDDLASFCKDSHPKMAGSPVVSPTLRPASSREGAPPPMPRTSPPESVFGHVGTSPLDSGLGTSPSESRSLGHQNIAMRSASSIEADIWRGI
jgi:hypothetical protein